MRQIHDALSVLLSMLESPNICLKRIIDFAQQIHIRSHDLPRPLKIK